MPRNKTQHTVERSPPAPAPTRSNIANDIASNVISGFAFGAGSSIARNTIESMCKSKPELKPESSLHSEYLECLKHNHEDTCKAFFSDM